VILIYPLCIEVALLPHRPEHQNYSANAQEIPQKTYIAIDQDCNEHLPDISVLDAVFCEYRGIEEGVAVDEPDALKKVQNREAQTVNL